MLTIHAALICLYWP